MSETRLWLSVLAMVMAIIGVVTWLRWTYLQPRLAWFGVAPLTYLLHVLLFYLVLIIMRPAPTEFFSQWSIVLRIQALATIIAAAFIMIFDRNRRGK